MGIRRAAGVTTLIAAAFACAAPAGALAGEDAYIVQLADGADPSEVAARAPGAEVLYEYDTALSGFAAEMSASSAAALEKARGVVSVTPNRDVRMKTTTTPDFLGLTGDEGVWAGLPGHRGGTGVVIGFVDSGIWPENPSFDSLARPGSLPEWNGVCDAGASNPVTCNNKLIGARYYHALGPIPAGEFASPRDASGFGTQVAAVAAGNLDTPASINGQSIGTLSGMAPNARIAAYKACWMDGITVCTTTDMVAAIDQAVADGVDVLHMSANVGRTTVSDPVSTALRGAAAAGIHVVGTAGDAGPAHETVNYAAPWVTTVAAGTHDRISRKTVTLGNGASYTGVGLGSAVPTAPIIDSVVAGLAGQPAAEVENCFIGSLDPAKVAGKIVLCRRGVNARIDKSQAVENAGGVGMVLYNNPDNSLNADPHFVPTVHVNAADGIAIKAYAATAGATASIGAAATESGRAPAVSPSAGRGPSPAVGGDVLKPDLLAPGQDIITATSPAGSSGNNFTSASSSIYASAHVAGMAALLKQDHPFWGPMRIKSALMTTASQTDNQGDPIQDGGSAADAFDFGSGHIVPAAALDPGLIYNSNERNWVRFLCGAGALDPQAPECQAGSRDPSDLNSPNIAIGDLVGKQTVVRRVANLDRPGGRYRVEVDAPPGVSVRVKPSVLDFEFRDRARYRVSFRRTDAAFDEWTQGSLTWSDGEHSVRSAIAVRPRALDAPPAVTGSGASGSAPVEVTPGYGFTLSTVISGLAASTVSTQNLAGENATFNVGAPAAGPATWKVTTTVPAWTKLSRVATFASDVPAGTDLDLYAYNAGTSTLVRVSASGGADETIDLPGPGTYDIYVNVFDAPGAATTANLHTWLVPPSSAGNLTATPASQAVTSGNPVNVDLAWSGLTAGQRYLGLVEWLDNSTTLGRTIVAVNP